MTLSGFPADREVAEWDEVTGRLVRATKLGPGPLEAFSVDGRWVAYIEQVGSTLGPRAEPFVLRLLSFREGRIVSSRAFTHIELGYAESLGVSTEGRTIITRGKAAELLDASIRVYSQALVEEKKHAGWPDLSRDDVVSPDGRWVALVPSGKAVRVVDTSSGKEVVEFPVTSTYALTATFSPDSRRLLWTEQNDVVHIVDVGSWRELRRFELGAQRPPSASFDARGERLVLTDGYRAAWVDLSSESEELRLGEIDFGERHTPIDTVALSPDGTRAAFGKAGVVVFASFGESWIRRADLGGEQP
jgi:WD40 repeat protein